MELPNELAEDLRRYLLAVAKGDEDLVNETLLRVLELDEPPKALFAYAAGILRRVKVTLWRKQTGEGKRTEVPLDNDSQRYATSSKIETSIYVRELISQTKPKEQLILNHFMDNGEVPREIAHRVSFSRAKERVRKKARVRVMTAG